MKKYSFVTGTKQQVQKYKQLIKSKNNSVHVPVCESCLPLGGLESFGKLLILQRRRVVLEGQKESNINTGTSERLEGTFSMKVSLGADVAPKANVLVYSILPNGELIADSREFMVSKCFRNKVNLHFLEPQVSPGSETSLHLKAAADSLCSLRVVDQSVFLLKPEEDLSADKVYSATKQTRESSHVSEEDPPPCLTFGMEVYDNVTYNLAIPSISSEVDVYRIILDMGLYILTDISIRKSVRCPGTITVYLNESENKGFTGKFNFCFL
ncbi:murinoglobulin-1-like [Protopterus annectens]|uniref:murinoglobulin-1-like n=1 Tax=Protopterus annectens TaxID=7888 RepID=UPI001CFAC3E6|nr:murinoglobulin-1-like [Protopterus annectens]